MRKRNDLQRGNDGRAKKHIQSDLNHASSSASSSPKKKQQQQRQGGGPGECLRFWKFQLLPTALVATSSHSHSHSHTHTRTKLKLKLKCCLPVIMVVILLLFLENVQRYQYSYTHQDYREDEKSNASNAYVIADANTDADIDIQLWSGEKMRTKNENVRVIDTVEIAIAYCRADLSWMFHDVLAQIPSDIDRIRITILSKCGRHEMNVDTNVDVPNFHEYGDPRLGADDVRIIPLPNVGGCDYAYAHFLNLYIDEHEQKQKQKQTTIISKDAEASASASASAASSTIILFIKDTPRTKTFLHMPHHERYRSIREMIDILITGSSSTSPSPSSTSYHEEFICGAKPTCDVSPYHDTDTLYAFTKANYVRASDVLMHGASRINSNVTQPDFNTAHYANLRDFHVRALDWTFPNSNANKNTNDNDGGGGGGEERDGGGVAGLTTLTEVCYGGTFAVTASRIMELSQTPRVRRAMALLEDNLQRNATTTIEEHFAERTWAGLLANPLSAEDSRAVGDMGVGGRRWREGTKSRMIIKDKGQIFGALRAGDVYKMCSWIQIYSLHCRRRWCSLWSR